MKRHQKTPVLQIICLVFVISLIVLTGCKNKATTLPIIATTGQTTTTTNSSDETTTTAATINEDDTSTSTTTESTTKDEVSTTTSKKSTTTTTKKADTTTTTKKSTNTTTTTSKATTTITNKPITTTSKAAATTTKKPTTTTKKVTTKVTTTTKKEIITKGGITQADINRMVIELQKYSNSIVKPRVLAEIEEYKDSLPKGYNWDVYLKEIYSKTPSNSSWGPPSDITLGNDQSYSWWLNSLKGDINHRYSKAGDVHIVVYADFIPNGDKFASGTCWRIYCLY